jgi:hypothetical protein
MQNESLNNQLDRDYTLDNVDADSMTKTPKDRAAQRKYWGEKKRKEQWAYEDGMSLEQAENMLEEKQAELKDPNKKIKDKPITQLDTKSIDTKRFIAYAISLLPTTEQGILAREVLTRRMYGQSYEAIGYDLWRTPPGIIRMIEREAIQRVKDEIHKTRNSGAIPIVGA